MNLAEKPHQNADCSVNSVPCQSPVFRISKRLLSKFITASNPRTGNFHHKFFHLARVSDAYDTSQAGSSKRRIGPHFLIRRGARIWRARTWPSISASLPGSAATPRCAIVGLGWAEGSFSSENPQTFSDSPVDALPGTVYAPSSEVVVDGRPSREVVRE